jgi:hypothetical protein
VIRPPARCNACQASRVAWVRPRVDFCYECLPGGPFVPPACRKCASKRYFSGDVRQICDLFGVNIETAMRYALTLGHPDLERRTPDESASTCLDRLVSKTID